MNKQLEIEGFFFFLHEIKKSREETKKGEGGLKLRKEKEINIELLMKMRSFCNF